MFCRSSMLSYSDRHVNLPHECPAIDRVVAHVCTKGEKSPDVKHSEDKRSRRSSLSSRFVKFLSCSGKSKKTRKSASQCSFPQPHMASGGEHLKDRNVNPPLLERVSNRICRRRSGNDDIFSRASSSVADINIIASLYERDLNDVDDCVSPSKHRRLSLPIGFTPEPCEDTLGNRRQPGLVSDTPGSVSQNEEISRPRHCRDSQSRRRLTPARKFDAMLHTLRDGLTPKHSKASPMHLHNYTVEPWSKHLQNQVEDSSSKHLYNRVVNSSSKHLQNQIKDSSSRHLQDQVVNLSSKHLQNQIKDSSSKHLYNLAVDSCNDGQKQLTLSCKQSSKKYFESLNLGDKQMSQYRQHLSKTTDSLNDCPKQTVNSNNDCPKQTANSAKPVGADSNMAGGEVKTAGCLQNMDPGSQDHVDQAARVASWAVHFDKLLQDPLGVNIFTKFLEKEFSDENMRFWQVCQRFRDLTDRQQQQALARDIYSRHIAARASDPVNVDSAARSHTELLLDSPTSAMFDLAQNQIQRLMKLDSYPRFLKSDLYKNVLVQEMEGNIQPEQTPEIKKDKKQSVVKENGGKRRRSLLPWMRFL